MVPWSKLTRVSPRTELLDALRAMDRQNVAQLPVVDGDQLVGVLTREQVLRYVHMRSQFRGLAAPSPRLLCRTGAGGSDPNAAQDRCGISAACDI